MRIFCDSLLHTRLLRFARRITLARPHAFVAGMMLGCVLLLQPLHAAEEGRFEVARASTRLVDQEWLLDALLDLSLGKDEERALQSGVTLTIQLQCEIVRKNTFWTDEVVLERQQNIELRYMLLSQRYVVTYLETNTQSSFATLYSALRQISLLRDYPLVSVDQLGADDNFEAGLRVVLVQKDLPGPLQMLAFWRGDFSLESEWYKWNLKP